MRGPGIGRGRMGVSGSGGQVGVGGGLRGQVVVGYLGLTLVFVWNSALRKKIGRNFSGIFCQCWQNFYFDGALGYHSTKLRRSLVIIPNRFTCGERKSW